MSIFEKVDYFIALEYLNLLPPIFIVLGHHPKISDALDIIAIQMVGILLENLSGKSFKL